MTNYVKFLSLALIASLSLSGCGCKTDCHESAPVIHSAPVEKKTSFKYGEFRSPSDTPAAVAPVMAEAVDVPTASFAVAPIESAQNASVRSNDVIEEAPIAAVVSLPSVQKGDAVPATDLQYVLEQWQKLPDSAKTDIMTIIKTTK